MLAALRVAEKRVLGLIEQHGVSTVLQAQKDLVEYAGLKALNVQKTIPNGTYEFWDYLDDDYNSNIPVRVHVK